MVFKKYHNFFNVFSKKESDTLPLDQKYNHKIYLKNEQRPDYALLYKIFSQKLDAIKRYLDSHLAKKFI